MTHVIILFYKKSQACALLLQTVRLMILKFSQNSTQKSDNAHRYLEKESNVTYFTMCVQYLIENLQPCVCLYQTVCLLQSQEYISWSDLPKAM